MIAGKRQTHCAKYARIARVVHTSYILRMDIWLTRRSVRRTAAALWQEYLNPHSVSEYDVPCAPPYGTSANTCLNRASKRYSTGADLASAKAKLPTPPDRDLQGYGAAVCGSLCARLTMHYSPWIPSLAETEYSISSRFSVTISTIPRSHSVRD